MAFLLISLYVFFFGLLSILKYNFFLYYDFDLAVHTQTLYNIINGSIESSILGIPFLGNHLNLVLFLIAPVYLVLKSALTPLILQTLALGISAYPIYLIAKEALPKKFDLLILFAYLFYPALGYVNLFEFHPTAFATLFISAALYFMYKNRFGLYFLFVMLTLSCQESTPLVILPMGIYLLITGRRFRWWFFTILAGVIWFWLAVYVVIPYFGKGVIKFIFLYSYLGDTLGKILENILRHPFKILEMITIRQNFIYLNQIFGPILFLPLLSPIAFLGGIPVLLQHLLSARPTEHSIYFHYTAELIPFIFFAAIFALKKIISLKTFYGKEKFLSAGLFIVTIWANIILGPHARYPIYLKQARTGDPDRIKETAVRKIPAGAAVAGTFEFLPRLANRKNLYSLHHVAMGTYTLSDIPYTLPDITEYLIVDFEDYFSFKTVFFDEQSPGRLRRLFNEKGFGIIDTAQSIVLFKKGAAGNYFLYRILPDEPKICLKLSVDINQDIRLIGYTVNEDKAEKEAVSFNFYWKCARKTNRIYGALLEIVDEKNRQIKQNARFLCYRIYPTNEWQKGEIIEEFYRLILPSEVTGKRYKIRMAIFEFYTNKIQNISSEIKGVVENNIAINLLNSGRD